MGSVLRPIYNKVSSVFRTLTLSCRRLMRLCIHIRDEMQHQQEKTMARVPQSYHSSKPSKLIQSSRATGEGRKFCQSRYGIV